MNETRQDLRGLKDMLAAQASVPIPAVTQLPPNKTKAVSTERTGELIASALTEVYEQFAKMIEGDSAELSKRFEEYKTATVELASKVREIGRQQAEQNQDWTRRLQESTEKLNDIGKTLGIVNEN